jgi:hypothetical protein
MDSVVFYVLWLALDTAGQGGWGRISLAKWFGCTVNTVDKIMADFVGAGYAYKRKVRSSGKFGYAWEYGLLPKGREHFIENQSHIRAVWRDHRDQKYIDAMEIAQGKGEPAPKSKKQKKQEAAGQKELF